MANQVGAAYVSIMPSMDGFAGKTAQLFSSNGSACGTSFSNGFNKGMGGLSSAQAKFGTFGTKMSAIAGAVAGTAQTVVSGAMNLISSSISGAVSRVDTLNNFPKVMSNLGYSSDAAAASIQRIQKSLDGLPSSTNQVASMVQQLAPLCSSLDEATTLGLAMNNMMLASGASTADVSRAMQQYTQILSKGKPDMQDWRTLQEVMPGQLNQVAQAMLGTTATSTDLYNALKDGTVSMDDFNQAVMDLNSEGINGFASFEQQAKDATQGIGTAVSNIGTRAQNAVAKVIQAIGAENISGAINSFSGSFSGIGDAVASGINAAKPYISSLVSFIQANSGTILGVIGSIAASFAGFSIAGKVQGIVSAISLMGTNLVGLVSKLGLVKGAFSFFGIAASPVTLVVAAVAALAAGMAYFFTQTEEGQAALEQITQILGDGLGGACETLGPLLQSLGDTLGGALAEAMPTIGSALTQAASVISGVIIAVLPTVISIVTQVAAVLLQVAQAVLPIIIAAVSTIASIVQTAIPIAQAVFTAAMTAILAVVNMVWPVIQAVISAAMGVIQAVISTVSAAISGDWDGTWNGIQSILSAVWSGMCGIVSALIGAIQGAISGALGTIQGIWSGAWSAVQGVLNGAWSGIVSGVSSGISQVVSFVSSIPSRIVSALGNVGSILYNAGSSIISGFLNGMKGAIGGVYDFASGIAGTVASLKGPIPYDRKVLIPNGIALMQSLETGLREGFPSVADYVSGMAGELSACMSIEPGSRSYEGDVISIPSNALSIGVEADVASDGSYAVLEWLDRNLPDIIETYTPTMTDRDFKRKVRAAV